MSSHLESLGSASFRVRIGSADEGARRGAALRASGAVDDAWHSESHLALTPRAGHEARALLEMPAPASVASARAHRLETVLDGPDLLEVARAAHWARGKLERVLFETELTVSFVGFSPGFPYLRGLDPALHLPRRSAPRPRIPKGSLALAGGFAGIYPSATAGGWNLVGRVLDSLLDELGPLLAAGDRVRLVPASSDVTLRDPDRRAPPAITPAFVLEEVRGLSFVEDGGRRGRLHQGVPSSGALLPSALARANAAVGNAPGAAGIERYGALRIAALRDLTVATEAGKPRRLRAGQDLDLDWHGEVRAGYVAISGGIDVPEVLGGRGTHVRAGLGGMAGRALRRGDVFAVLAEHGAPSMIDTPEHDPSAPILIHAGPDLGAFAEGSLARLTSTEWRISLTSDRMGSRLEGGTLAHRPAAAGHESAPLVAGAIEVPPSGEPIVLGPEHPTTGGYPVIAVVHEAQLEALLARPLGSRARFTLAPARSAALAGAP